METVTERVVVAFEGGGSGAGELSWGQLDAWMTVRRLRSWMPMGGVKPLTPGTTLAEVCGELRYLVSRYPVMRTKLVLDDPHRPRQVVHGSGEITMEIADAAGEDPAEVAEALRRRYSDTELDFATHWPVRMGVVRDRGQLTHMVVLMSHVATDAAGARAMLRDVAAHTSTPLTGLQPLDQAAWQRSPAGQRQNSAALRHYESILRGITPERYGQRPQPEATPVWDAEFTSPAMRLAVATIAEHTKVDADALLLSIFAIALHRVTGVNPVVVRPLVGNRFRPGLDGVVCSASQSGLCVLDVAGVPFAEVLARVKRSTMTAYKYAYHDPFDMAALHQRICAERGTDLDISCFFNNRRAITGPVPPATPRLIAEALPHSELHWTPAKNEPLRRMFTRIENDTASALRMSLFLDTHLITRADAEACLRGMETVAAETAQAMLS
jgi:hypothetical protein